MRIYDPRSGRFLSVDPIAREYPWNSTYAFAENDVIRNVDLDGKEKFSVELKNAKYESGKAFVEVSTYVEVNLRIINLSSIKFSTEEKSAIASTLKSNGNIFDGSFQDYFSLGLAFDPNSGKQISDASKFIKLYTSGYLNVEFESSKFVDGFSEIESENTLILALVDNVPAQPDEPSRDLAGVMVRGSHVAQAEASYFKPKIEKTNTIPSYGIKIGMHEIGHSLGADHSCKNCADLMAEMGLSGMIVSPQTRGEIATSLMSAVLKSNRNKLPTNNSIVKHFNYSINPQRSTENAINETNSTTKQ